VVAFVGMILFSVIKGAQNLTHGSLSLLVFALQAGLSILFILRVMQLNLLAYALGILFFTRI
jgi:hypothetical protein